MLLGDGTGPRDMGPGTGRGAGGGRGGRGGRPGRKSGAGPSCFCVCFACGTKIAHQAGISCQSANCPRCGAKMVRE